VIGAENRGEDTGEEVNRSLGKALQCPVRYTVRARSLADLETTRLGVVGVAAAVLTLVAAFFLDFLAARLGAAVDLGLGFLGLAVSLVAVTIGCLGASVTG